MLPIFLFLFGCSSRITNPLWDSDCPFAGLEFTTVVEKDSISRTLQFNDSLIASLATDIEKLKVSGKVGNNLSATINKFKSNTSTRKIEIDDPEYIQWIQDKTKTLCGLHGQLTKKNIYTTNVSRQNAENLMLKLIEDLKAYSEKKSLELNEVDNSIILKQISGDVVISQNQTGGITAHTVNNYRVPKRNINLYIKEIIGLMKSLPIAGYRLEYSDSEFETQSLALQIDTILRELQWYRLGPIIRKGGPQYTPGITFYTLREAEPMKSLVNLLWQALGNKGVMQEILVDIDNIFTVHGWKAQELPNKMDGVVIIIGPNPEN